MTPKSTHVASEIRRDWNSAPLPELIEHIVTTHHEFLKLELPRVGQSVKAVVQAHGDKDPAALNELAQVYEELWQELDLHMHKEELMLFPVIEGFARAAEHGSALPPTPFGTVRNPITMMQMEHTHATGGFGRIRELTSGYEVPPYACETYRAMLNGLKRLDTDLAVHIGLEDHILFPRAIALERQLA